MTTTSWPCWARYQALVTPTTPLPNTKTFITLPYQDAWTATISSKKEIKSRAINKEKSAGAGRRQGAGGRGYMFNYSGFLQKMKTPINIKI
jgi:hypothetical protein